MEESKVGLFGGGIVLYDNEPEHKCTNYIGDKSCHFSDLVYVVGSD